MDLYLDELELNDFTFLQFPDVSTEKICKNTLPETNMAPTNGWLE